MFGQFLIGAFADTRLLAHCFTPNAILAGPADTTVEHRCFLGADHTSFFCIGHESFPLCNSIAFILCCRAPCSIYDPNLSRILKDNFQPVLRVIPDHAFDLDFFAFIACWRELSFIE